MKVVYIAGCYRTKSILKRIINIYRARKVAIKYWKRGYAVICPHSNSGFFDGKAPDKTFLDGYLELVRRSDILAMLPGWSFSSGSCKEHEFGMNLRKKIIYMCKESHEKI